MNCQNYFGLVNHIFQIPKPCSLCLSTFLSIGMYLPLQQLLVRQMSVLVLTDNFLKFGTPQCTKFDSAKVQNLGNKCTSRV